VSGGGQLNPAPGFGTATAEGRMVLRNWPISGRCDGTLSLRDCVGPKRMFWGTDITRARGGKA